MPLADNSAWGRFFAAPQDHAGAGAGIHANQTVLITGAGGFIGSALAKSVARDSARHIILLDSAEQSLFEIDATFAALFAGITRTAVLGSVCDQSLLDSLLSRHRPDIIYHAAAFKHVPLLESNPFAAIQNNSLGTRTLVAAASRHGVPNFVLISTDKAVNPVSMLGVSKRIAELVVVAEGNADSRMNAIRLVNVIGSPGSVVPMFQRQLLERSSITVTHPDASRWFLTLQETVDAILAAGCATGRGTQGRVFVPTPGEPVKIADLAAALISAAGSDVPITFTGLRPGDKLCEELIGAEETKEGCVNGSLLVLRTRSPHPDALRFCLHALSDGTAQWDRDALARALRNLAPEYSPSGITP